MGGFEKYKNIYADNPPIRAFEAIYIASSPLKYQFANRLPGDQAESANDWRLLQFSGS